MARDISTITDSIDAQLTANLSAQGITLSASAVAEWKLWRDVAANTDYSFEVVMDAFQSDVQTYIDTKQLGSLSWYALQCLAFQYGDTLLVSSEGVIYYAVIDPSKQIIKLASVKESIDDMTGVVTLVIKVAKLVGTTVTKLEDAEMLAFTDYMRLIKIVGTKLQLVSDDADIILYDLTVVYNPEVPQTTVDANVQAALNAFKTNYGFDPTFYKSSFEAAVKSADGVVAVGVTTLTGTPNGGSPTTITLDYELAAGYFNYDGASSITYQPQ
jgi:hypothetical protein